MRSYFKGHVPFLCVASMFIMIGAAITTPAFGDSFWGRFTAMFKGEDGKGGGASPTADFSGTPTAGYAPLTVEFSDLSIAGSSDVTNWSWNFGDLSTGSGENTSHIYASPGVYTVSLEASSASGNDTESKTDYITVYQEPTVNFHTDITSGPAPFSVTFVDDTDSHGVTITGWSWDFGDGGTSTDQSHTHVYSYGGTYSVKLTVTTAYGERSYTRSNYISVDGPPRADFTGTPTVGLAPLNVAFADASKYSTPITDWSWNFGDLSTGSGENTSHIYTTPGKYSVSLSVISTAGNNSETKTNYITVAEAPEASFNITSTTYGYTPLTVTFKDTSTDGGTPITSWSWDFGDSTTSTEQNPTHTYTTTGNYSVYLTVTTAAASDKSNAKGVFVATPMVFDQQPESLRRYVGESAEFTLAVSGGITSYTYEWWFDNGSITSVPGDVPSITINPVRMEDAGFYWCDVTDLVTVSSNTPQLEVAEQLRITVPPVGANLLTGQAYEFSASAEGGFAPLNYQWNHDGLPIGGATLSSYAITRLATNDAGDYTVTVTDSYNAEKTSGAATLEVDQGLPAIGVVGVAGLVGFFSLVGVVAVRRNRVKE
jgi:PKD repeat protein